MKEILKVVNTWIDVEKRLLSDNTGIPTAVAYHNGAISYLSRVATLMRCHLETQAAKPEGEMETTNET